MILKPEEQERAIKILEELARNGEIEWDNCDFLDGYKKVDSGLINSSRLFLRQLWGHACSVCGMPHETAENPCDQCMGEVE